jgi:hypothetical protein
MSHVEVKVGQAEPGGPVNVWYPSGSKSANMRQKLEDALWEHIATEEAVQGNIDTGKQPGTLTITTSHGKKQKPLPYSKSPNPRNKSNPAFPDPELFRSRKAQTDEELSRLLRKARRIETKFKELAL